MYGVSPEMLANMYVKSSLQNQEEGFSFSVKNKIESGSISGVAKLAVDGEERSLEGATVQLGEKVKPVSEISWSSSLYVPYGATLTIFVPGELEAGEHTINMQINVPELGRISLPVTDTVA
jgi:hydroxymethylglutaryl-CoA reductase (NADPH)